MKALAARCARIRLAVEILLVRRSAWMAIPVAGFLVLALLHGGVVAPARADLDRLQAELARRERERSAMLAAPPAAASAVADPSGLHDLLPPASQASADLRALFELAKQHELRAVQADYQSGRERHGQFESIQVTMPLSGGYPAIRRWIEDVLRTMPHASIDQVAFEREAMSAADVVARIKVTLWLRPGGVSTGPAGDVVATAPSGEGSR